MIERIGKYQIQGEIGRGGFGRVYRAFDPTVGRVVAIKVISAEGDETLVSRFRNEAIASGKLRHKNIVTIYEFGEQNDLQYLVMEFLEGQDLQHVMASDAKLSMAEKVDIMSQVADGLHCAHVNGVVHRDVKPANIMVLPDGGVKIMDFGIARLTRDKATRLTQQGFLIGTVLYMAPEQLRGGQLDELGDIWAYGVIFHELLVGRHPFQAPDPTAAMFRIASEDPPPVRNLVPDCPEALSAVIERLLSRDRELRYQTFEDVRFDLEPILLDLRKQQAAALLEEARQYLQRSQVDEASTAVRRALDLDATNPEARRLRERLQRESQLRASGTRVATLLKKSEEELARRSFQQAAELLESALRLDPRNSEVRGRLERVREVEKQTARAARLVAEAQQSLQIENLTAAFQQASEAARADPQNREAAELLERIQQQMDVRAGRRAIAEGLNKSEGLLVLRAYEDAIDILNGLAASHPGTAAVEQMLARAQAGLEERRRQEERDQEVAEAQAMLKASHFAEAVPRLEAALARFPGDPELVRLLKFARDSLEASQHAKRVEELGRAAWKLYKSGRFDEAIQAVEQALATYPAEPSLMRLSRTIVSGKISYEREQALLEGIEQCRGLQAEGRLDEALQAARRLLAENPGHAPLLELAQQVEQERDERMRREAIEKAASEAAEMLQQGRPDSATRLLEQVTARYPGNEALRKLLSDAEEVRLREKTRVERENEVAGIVRSIEQELARENWDSALLLTESARRKFPDEAEFERLADRVGREKNEFEREVLVAKARKRLAAEDFEDAIRALEAGLRTSPQDSHLQELLGQAQWGKYHRDCLAAAREHLRLLRFDEGEQSLAQLLTLAPQDEEANELLAALRRERAREQERQAEDRRRQEAEELRRREAEETVRQREQEALRRAEQARQREEEVRRREDEAARREEEARRRAAEAQQREEDARRREEEAARQREQEALRRAEQARQREDESRRLTEETARREEEARRRAAEARQREEEVRRREDEAARQREQETLRRAEEARQREEEARRLAEEASRREQEARRRTAEARKREEEARKSEEETRKLERKLAARPAPGTATAAPAGRKALSGAAAAVAVVVAAAVWWYGRSSPAADFRTTPETLSFSFRQGGPAPTPHTLSVGSGMAKRSFRVTVSGDWLSVTPDSGETPGSLQVAVRPGRLTPGAYAGIIAIEASDGSKGLKSVQVKLTVEATVAAKPQPPPEVRPPVTPQRKPGSEVAQTSPPPPVQAPPSNVSQAVKPAASPAAPPLTPIPAPAQTQARSTPAGVPGAAEPPPTPSGPDYGSPFGTWQWRGELANNQRLVLATSGVLEGGGALQGKTLPGRPVTVRISPDGVVVEEVPVAANQFGRIVLRNKTGRTVTSISVRWTKVSSP